MKLKINIITVWMLNHLNRDLIIKFSYNLKQMHSSWLEQEGEQVKSGNGDRRLRGAMSAAWTHQSWSE